MDTGTSFMYVPKSAFSKFVAGVTKGLDSFQSSGYVLGPCDRTLYKSIFFYIDGYYIEITPATYVLSISYQNYCFLALA